MYLKEDNKGFIFSVDATLAILIGLIALAGIASANSSSINYRQYGYLQLCTQANDAARVITLNGAIDNAIWAMKIGNSPEAKRILRDNLIKVLPERFEFKLSIGENRLTVYPDNTHCQSFWEKKFENAFNRATMTQVSPTAPKENYWRVLTWIDHTRENLFMENMQEMRPQWGVTKIFGNEKAFEENIKENNYDAFDAIFIPDADLDFDSETINAIKNFCNDGGRLVAGGSSLFNNSDLLGTFGITSSLDRRDPNNYEGIEDMYIWHPEHNFNHPIIEPFVVSYRVKYGGRYVYYYGDSQVGDGYNSTSATVLSSWGDAPESTRLYWNGIIANDVIDADPTGSNTAVFFNMDFVQSYSNGVGAYEWVKLAVRAAGSGSRYLKFRPVKLHIWRREEA